MILARYGSNLSSEEEESMAKLYNTKSNEVIWSDSDLLAPVEDAYFELSGFLAMKKLDGHDRTDQWYMLVH